MENIENTHKKLLELIEEFDHLCEANHIHYTLHGGSLLGAIREHGFIPWDDDLDIAMRRADFNSLREAVGNDREYTIYGDIKKQFRRNGDNTLWVDIFICDYITDTCLSKLKLIILTALDIMNRDAASIKLSNFSKYSKAKQYLFRFFYHFGKLFPRRVKVRLYNLTAEKAFPGNRRLLHRSNDTYKGRQEPFPAQWMEEYIRVPFETLKLPVLKNYHEILVKCYGDNYMIPLRDDRNSQVHDIIRESDTSISL